MANASVIGYSSNPTTNSVDFASGAAANGGAITTLDFENLSGYDAHMYPGVTFAFTTNAVLTSGLAGHGTLNGPTSPGEGLQDGSTHIYPGAAAYQMSITFDNAVLAAGFFLIDYYNPSGANSGTLQAWDGAAGTGNLIGSAVSAGFNFQEDNKYFIGILSTDANIKSITFGSQGAAGDGIYIDDVKYASVASAPEPGTWGLIGGGLLAGALFARRRIRL
ncbi:MAG TPA: PEP-CTERM sorting domain-containing protein [Bryobacteraceae bacterium]|nr:PEP-CTERM sorting domain-containing protein [Bryobacteraceae bacterium]